MIFGPASKEMVCEWRKIHMRFKDKIHPNKKSGNEVIAYLQEKYLLEEFNDEKAFNAVYETVLLNDFYKQKLLPNTQPEPRTFILKNEGNGKTVYDLQEKMWNNCQVFIGIDLSSGYVQIEGSCLLYNEILAFQGLDEFDIENCVRVADYIDSLKKFNPTLYNELCLD
ncbi:MAG: hypothetical protein IKV36_01325 [Clostridia bacterium]|nr:hypothetical protein [Clostridia bacterium]